MTETSLRAVFTFDEKAKRFLPAGHNLTFEKAETLATRLHEKGPRVATAVQPLRHKDHGYKNCQACKTAAKNLSESDTGISEDHTAESSEEPQPPR